MNAIANRETWLIAVWSQFCLYQHSTDPTKTVAPSESHISANAARHLTERL